VDDVPGGRDARERRQQEQDRRRAAGHGERGLDLDLDCAVIMEGEERSGHRHSAGCGWIPVSLARWMWIAACFRLQTG
jgi:hypothetical protein